MLSSTQHSLEDIVDTFSDSGLSLRYAVDTFFEPRARSSTSVAHLLNPDVRCMTSMTRLLNLNAHGATSVTPLLNPNSRSSTSVTSSKFDRRLLPSFAPSYWIPLLVHLDGPPYWLPSLLSPTFQDPPSGPSPYYSILWSPYRSVLAGSPVLVPTPRPSSLVALLLRPRGPLTVVPSSFTGPPTFLADVGDMYSESGRSETCAVAVVSSRKCSRLPCCGNIPR